MQLGSNIEDSVVEERLKQQRADQCVSIVFSVSSLAVFKHDCTSHGDPSSHFFNLYSLVQLAITRVYY